MTRLQILIPTIGKKGIDHVVASGRPRIDGVEYLVSWQQPDEDIPVPEELCRDDFRIKIIKSRGVARNRNSLLDMITAPLALWSDDTDFNSVKHVDTVLKAFEENPEADLLSFRAHHPYLDKKDPEYSFDYPHLAKGYYLMTSELAMRADRLKGKVRFNEFFGVGAFFPMGEEELYAHDCARAGFKWRYLPLEIVHIPGDCTSARIWNTEGMYRTKGAINLHLHPFTWPLRMLVHSFRYRNVPGSRGSVWHMKQWMKGVYQALRHNVFKKSNYVAEEG